MVTDLGRGAARIRRKDKPRIPRWLHTILEIPPEMKLLGANLIIVGVAVLLLFGPVRLQPARLIDAYVVVAALIVGATVNFGLVRLALRPIEALERVAKRVSEGRLAERVPASMVADHEMTRLSTTINEMLDSLAADRERIQKLDGEVVYAEERERAQVARELHDSVVQMLTDASFQLATAANEIGNHAALSRLATVRDLLRVAIAEIRNVSHSVHLRVAMDLISPTALEALGNDTRQRSFADVGSTSLFPEAVIPGRYGVVMRQDIRDVESWTRGTNQR
jgi:signal transduction histidine kinase